VLGDLDRRLAVELLEKAYSANTHYVDPSDVEQDDESVGVPAVTILVSPLSFSGTNNTLSWHHPLACISLLILCNALPVDI